MPTRRPFVVGHRSRKGLTVLFLRRPGVAVILGPWTLTAVVSAN